MHFRTPSSVASALLLALLLAVPFAAYAQTDDSDGEGGGLPIGSSTTTTTEASTTTTTTTSPPEGGDEDGDGAPPEQGDGGGDGAEPADAEPRVVPPEYQALINSVPRTRANNTRRLLEALQPLGSAGMSETEAAVVGFGRFPVAGYATFVDDWWFPRWVPSFHLHQGTDIFAAYGTPVRSPIKGTVRQANGPVGGLAVYVTREDGTYVYMGHLSAFAAGAETGTTVEVGTVVGYVGDSGNARGSSPHVHFEIHPAPQREVVVGKGRNRTTELRTVPVAPGTKLPPINPKPWLDRWIEEALAEVPAVIDAYGARQPASVASAPTSVGPADLRFSGPAAPPRSQVLWASSANAVGGVLAVASAELDRIDATVDWDEHVRRERAYAQLWAEADATAVAVLRPLTPEPLAKLLYG